MRCPPCDRSFVDRSQIPGPGEAWLKSRNLCRPCYDRALRDGTLIDYPRTLRRAEDVAQDARELLAEGYSRTEIARRLGMQWDSIRTAMRRMERREGTAA